MGKKLVGKVEKKTKKKKLEKDIVIKSYNGIGDLLFVTPTLRVIKEAYPDSVITINTNYPELLLDNPFIDNINIGKEGVFLGYPDPIHQIWPTEHHIISDWRVICNAYELDTERPEFKPELYLAVPGINNDPVGVQVIHKGHWHKKKVWPKFYELASLPGFFPIPKVNNVLDLVSVIGSCKAVVCSEGGISHIARAVGTPAIVVYGGFAHPDWNGYKEQINICNEKWCSYCYNPKPCENKIERLCMKEITLEQVIHSVGGLSKMDYLSNHDAKHPIEEDASNWCKGEGVDVGGGHWPLKGAHSVDDRPEENAYMLTAKSGTLDYVFSSHCLEHLDRPKEALIEWIRALKKRGLLYLYLPHTDYMPWRKESMPRWHKHNLYLLDVLEMLEGIEVIEIIHKDFWFGQKIIGRKK